MDQILVFSFPCLHPLAATRVAISGRSQCESVPVLTDWSLCFICPHLVAESGPPQRTAVQVEEEIRR
ncbi:unnamed protein product [Boreogadus saida]